MKSSLPVKYAAERLALRLLWVFLAAFALLAVAPQLWRLFSPFLVALPVAAALQPSIRFSQRKLRLKPGLAVGLWVLVVCAVAFVLLYWFVSFLLVQLSKVVPNAPGIVGSVTGMLRAAANRVLDAAQDMPSDVGSAIRSSLDSAIKTLSEGGISLATDLGNGALSFAAGLPYALIYLSFLVPGIFFITAQYPRIHRFLTTGTDNKEGEHISVLRKSAAKGLLGYLRVQLLFSLITLLLSWVCFQSFGFEYAMLIGVAAALLELIPQFGCGTLYLPWSVISFIVGQSRNGWIVLGLYLFYQLIRRSTEPMLLGSNLGVSPLLSLIGMFAGMQLAGVIGLILGPVAMVVLSSAAQARLFDGVVADLRILSRYMKSRWKRGKEEPYAGG